MRKEYLYDAACVIAIALSIGTFNLANSAFPNKTLIRLLGPQQRHGPISSAPDYFRANIALMLLSIGVGGGVLVYLLWRIVIRHRNARRGRTRSSNIR